eukprot:scaffold6994_cov120-Cylindrotheca_fusiformis.AAC.2
MYRTYSRWARVYGKYSTVAEPESKRGLSYVSSTTIAAAAQRYSINLYWTLVIFETRIDRDAGLFASCLSAVLSEHKKKNDNGTTKQRRTVWQEPCNQRVSIIFKCLANERTQKPWWFWQSF